MKKLLIAAAIGFTGVATTPAHADVVASTYLAVSNFFLIDQATGSPTTDVTLLSDNRNGTISASWGGVAAGPIDDSAGSGGTVDLTPLCVGSCGALPYTGDNDGTTQINLGAGNYSYADMFVSGSALAGGAAGLTRADSTALSVDTEGAANAEITNNLLASLTFTTGTTRTLFFAFDFDAFARAILSPDLIGTGSAADASTNFSIQLGSNDVLYSYSIGCNVFDVTGFTSCTESQLDQSAVSQSRTLEAGTYTVLITQKSAANIESHPVPEPSTLALAGLGLLGFGVRAWRKRA